MVDAKIFDALVERLKARDAVLYQLAPRMLEILTIHDFVVDLIVDLNLMSELIYLLRRV
jgi:hypothetical protein